MIFQQRRSRVRRSFLGGVVPLMLFTACGGSEVAEGPSGGDDGETADESDGQSAVLPEARGKSPSELLAQSLSYEGMRGVVEGAVVSDGETREVSQDDRTTLTTQYRFRVHATHGADEPLYEPGQVIDLVVPGGQLDDRMVEVEGAPQLAARDHVLVWVKSNVGDAAVGESTDERLVVSDANVAHVRGSIVRWQGEDFPLVEVVRTLQENPASPQ